MELKTWQEYEAALQELNGLLDQHGRAGDNVRAQELLAATTRFAAEHNSGLTEARPITKPFRDE